MSELNPPPFPDLPAAPPSQHGGPAERSGFGRWLAASWNDIYLSLVWFAGAALLGALIWWQITPLAEFTRTGDNGSMGEQQLGVQVASDGWFAAVAAGLGLLSGIVLLLWRKRDPVLMVCVVALGGVFATALMVWFGLLLGPDDPASVLPTVAEGGTVPAQLEVHSQGLYAVWSVAALLGAVGVIWGSDSTRPSRDWAPPTASTSYGPY